MAVEFILYGKRDHQIPCFFPPISAICVIPSWYPPPPPHKVGPEFLMVSELFLMVVNTRVTYIQMYTI